MEVNIYTVPEKKQEEEVNNKIQKITEERNVKVAEYFGVEPKSVDVKLYFSTGALKFAIDPNGDSLGLFSGYIDGSDEILLAHPSPIQPIFGDNLYDEMRVFIDYALTKFYFCKIYFPEVSDFKLYYKYLSESLATIYSGYFKQSIVDYEIKAFKEDRNYNKEKKVTLGFYVMNELSGVDFIFNNLDTIVKDEDIEKSIKNIYHKSMADLIKQKQRNLEEKKKEMNKVK